jgi:hypothetical protein
VQHWLRGGRAERADDDDATAQALRAAGVPEHLIERQCAPRSDYPLLPQNAPVVRVWCAIAATQWSVISGMGGSAYLGLRYEALPAVLELLQVAPGERPGVFRRLRVMEREALRLLNAAPRETGSTR